MRHLDGAGFDIAILPGDPGKSEDRSKPRKPAGAVETAFSGPAGHSSLGGVVAPAQPMASVSISGGIDRSVNHGA